jgi:ATP-binding cassette subfamily B protein
MAAIPGIIELTATLWAREEISEPEHAKPLRIDEGTVSVEDVTVETPDGAPILRDFSHRFEGGRVSAVVGRAGSGKSTLLTALARAFDPAGGRVCIDGTDIRTAALDSLRQSISFVGQFPPFLDGSLRDNLNLATEPVSDKILLEACAAVGLAPRLQELAAPRPLLDMPIYAEANKGALSGGERRLLAVARILAHRGRIILLDEPAAGLSADLKSRLAAVIKEQFAGSTVIVVDHDLGFIADIADRVVCLDDGRVVSSIPRAELFEQQSLFLELWNQQQTLHAAGMEIRSCPAISASVADFPTSV